MSERTIQIGIIQSASNNSKDQNFNNTVRFIRQAAKKGAQIICLQELFSTIYFCFEENYDHFSLAEKQSDNTILKLANLCKELKIVLIVPYFEKRTSGLYHNSAVVIDSDGTLLGNYRKQHIPDDPGYYEKFYFTPGDDGYQTFQTKYGQVGVLICWDQWFPEASRLTALQGAEVIFYPTAIGWPVGQEDKLNKKEFEAWQTIMRSHAIANGIHIVAVNRVGIEADNQFWGGSFIADPFGEIQLQASLTAEEVHIAPINLNLTEYYRQRWPFLRDRRTDTYKSITNRYSDMK